MRGLEGPYEPDPPKNLLMFFLCLFFAVGAIILNVVNVLLLIQYLLNTPNTPIPAEVSALFVLSLTMHTILAIVVIMALVLDKAHHGKLRDTFYYSCYVSIGVHILGLLTIFILAQTLQDPLFIELWKVLVWPVSGMIVIWTGMRVTYPYVYDPSQIAYEPILQVQLDPRFASYRTYSTYSKSDIEGTSLLQYLTYLDMLRSSME